ncbi:MULTISPECIES: beta-N-acetylhexosaminidase [unclassified Ruminococcus]|uniref:beta-N-acetylhexosaminidase n=1 Tax=unclassified Ruminococcus TaxID=2608920 RepID=UPI00210889AD|nr:MULTISPECIES: beta-N-acetylhexosaminidase [unclassified Ruminococcus]MCQ4022029.1 beta-N-acetylhexosaminidase [Ruminococcus sp. zg-924]MCQ4114565.1 beta-N-acetylhexosaminidase [Ruminococcus sp. zg-921]
MKKHIIKPTISAVLIALTLSLTSCSICSGSEESKPFNAPIEAPTEAPTQSAEEIILEKMTLEQKAAQTIVAGLSGTEVDDEFKALAQRGIGGAILFSANITDSAQLVNLTNQIKACSDEIPIITAMDEEGGRVTRLPDNVLSMPSAYSIAQQGSAEYANRAGQNLGNQIKAFGLFTGFSPVLDIWSNPDNTVIGDRAYGTTADEVCTYGIEALKGIMSTGTIAVAKHFPGHGDTDVDSHNSLPVVTKTKAELEQMELKPFKSAIENDIPGIMAAHILCSELDPDNPASLSKAIVTDLLKGELGFDGVVFTDDLTMGAISEQYTADQAAVKALNAGCDMLLVCFEYENANNTIDAIISAVNSGELSEERLDDAVLRILAMKNKYDVNAKQIVTPDIEAINEKTNEFLQ